MEGFVIEGGRPLEGVVRIKAAKNAVLPLLAASVLTDEKVTLCDTPNLTDIKNMLSILRCLGATVNVDGGRVEIIGGIDRFEIPDCLASEMRSSIFLLGSILARRGKAVAA
jgi:UDP-N-acetylglucosamine 1-carboxyvinyltransferase